VYNQTGQYIGSLIINGGREFGIKELNNYAKSVGINVLRIAPYTSEQNGTPERIRGIILGIARLMRIKADLLEHL
jgi:hypothetical protein